MLFDEYPVSDAEADDGTKLCLSQNPEQSVEDDIDRMMGHLRFPDGSTWEFSEFVNARLAFGLWERCGPFDLDVAPAVPVSIAAAKTADLAAWRYLAPDLLDTRNTAVVADDLGLSRKSSVSNYLNDVRWE